MATKRWLKDYYLQKQMPISKTMFVIVMIVVMNHVFTFYILLLFSDFDILVLFSFK